ncbi:MAG: glucose-6-phosphate dehydrogenase [Oligoflexia bacterium]|nr:glucose-6-phosphate dehydrogenase [Oligoflexia bacterium]
MTIPTTTPITTSVTTPTTPLKILTHEEFCTANTPDPCGIVIFGASGDLAYRRLIPSLYNLYKDKFLNSSFFVLGFARTAKNDNNFREEIINLLGEEKDALEFAKCFYYESGDYNSAASYECLVNRLQEIKKNNNNNMAKDKIIFYLATPPNLVETIIFHLSQVKLIYPDEGDLDKQSKWIKVVFEKPFGSDLESARKLNKYIHKHLRENQIYRIDHYLGKDSVQNILMFRFSNSIFEPLWNRQYIDHIQISALETLGVEHRAGYYDQTGALRDMFQNHMFQLLALIAMGPPARFDANQYRDEKIKVIKALRPIPKGKFHEFVVRGQYANGVINEQAVVGFRDEKNISPTSNTETFSAMKLFIDNWRWEGVPFYLRTGKRIGRAATEIVIQFKNIPHSIFYPLKADQLCPNLLSFQIGENEGISLGFEAKHPGPKLCMAFVNLNFCYSNIFGTRPLPLAYERLLLDCMLGEQILFSREDMVELSWEYITPILKDWENSPPLSNFPNYLAGSFGPEEANTLIERDGRKWILS